MTDRDPNSGKFVAGNRANPGGRPRTDLVLSALIDEAVTLEDWKFIIGELKKRARRGDLKAIEMLMDRRFGKPVQTNENKNENSGAYTLMIIGSDGKPYQV